MKQGDFSIEITFADDVKVSLGGADDLFVTPASGSESALLNEERLHLVRLVREAEQEACDETRGER